MYWKRGISIILTVCKIPELNWLKIGGVLRVSELDHQFFVFLLFFHVNLVQILQGSKIIPRSIRSCRIRQHSRAHSDDIIIKNGHCSQRRTGPTGTKNCQGTIFLLESIGHVPNHFLEKLLFLSIQTVIRNDSWFETKNNLIINGKPFDSKWKIIWFKTIKLLTYPWNIGNNSRPV